jgi:hypothetical protein
MKKTKYFLLMISVALTVLATGCPQGAIDPSPSPSPSPVPVTLTRIELLLYTKTATGVITMQVRDAAGTTVLTSTTVAAPDTINDWISFDVPNITLNEGTVYTIYAQRSQAQNTTDQITWRTSINGYPGKPSMDIGDKKFCFRTYDGDAIEQESACIEPGGWGGGYILYSNDWWGQEFIPGN